ncbi:MAG: hypothetical protein AMXMBFR84_17720 [Candidatus Hydrogenedentota bacterium]
MSEDTTPGKTHRKSRALIIGCVALALLAAGTYYIQHEAIRIRNEKQLELEVIASLAARHITEWRKEKNADGHRILEGILIKQYIRDYMADPASESASELLRSRLALELEDDEFDAYVTNLNAEPVFSASGSFDALQPTTKSAVLEAIRSQAPLLSDFYISQSNRACVDLVIPILSGDGEPMACVILQSDLGHSLFPFLELWSEMSDTGECLLVRKDGDYVVFISPMRYVSSPATMIRRPLTQTDLPAVEAVLGHTGFFEGKDYRGEDVIANLKHIPGSTWHLVTKTDASEVTHEIARRAVFVVGFGVLIFLLATAWTSHLFRRRQSKIYRDLYISERRARVAQSEFRSTFLSIADAVFTINAEGLVQQMNPAAERLTGWRLEEIHGKRLDNVIAILDEDTRSPLPSPVFHVLQVVKPSVAERAILITRQGIELPVARTASPIKTEDGVASGVVLNLRDQSSTRAAENALRMSEARFRTSLDAMLEGCQLIGSDWRYIYVNDVAVVQNRQPRDQLIGRTVHECFPGIEHTVVYAKMQQCMEERTAHNLETEFEFPDGQKGWFDVCIQPVPEGIFVLSLDISRRKRAEQRQKLWADAFAHSAQGIAIGDPGTGTLLSCNPAFANLRNMTVEQLTGYKILDLYPEEERESIVDHIAECDRSGYVRFEVRTKTHDGIARVLQMELVSVRDEEGKLLYRVATALDISPLIRAQELLRSNQAMLRQILDTIPQSVFWKDLEGRYLGCNKVFAAAAGADNPDWLIGKNDFDMPWSKEESEAYRADDQAVIESGQAKWHIIEHIQRADGVQIWADTSKLPLRDENGQIYGVLGVFEDITDRLRDQQALRESEERFRTAFENIPDVIVIYNQDLRITYINAATLLVTGRPASDYIGKRDEEIWPPEVYELYLPTLRAAVSERAIQHVEVALDLPVTGKRYLHITCVPIFDAKGRVNEVLTITHDYTARQKAMEQNEKLEAQFQQAQKMEAVGRLAGGVAHDFNNMLAVITGNAGMALDSLDPDDPLYADLQEIMLASQRSAELTRQLLAFARKQTVVPKVLQINETIEGMLKMLSRLIGENIELTFKPSVQPLQVRMDPSQIGQILANLVVNARDAIHDVGEIQLETAATRIDGDYSTTHADFSPGDYVSITVSDNGCGMSKETQSRLFEPFFTTKPQGEGTGLGLATVYGIVRQNNGFVNVYSEPGSGSSFRIYLPLHVTGMDSQSAVKTPTELATGCETVLLVEDEPALLKLSTRMLEQLGYRVLPADSPIRAVEIAKEDTERIDLLVTDVIMPQMSGRDLWKIISELSPHTRCLYTSGYTADVIARQGVLDEGIHFLQKPYSKEELAVKLREVIAKP